MAFKSAFGSFDAPTDFFSPPPPKPPHHGLLHNLLSDAINTAKGIPFGTYEFAKHPVRGLKLVGKSYADTYGHGFGHFKNVFMAHPLQPLLDAISIPLIAAGGLGVGIKGASFAAELGRTAELSDVLARSSKLAAAGKFAEADALRETAMRAPRLDKAAQRFRKGTSATTRMVEVKSVPGLSLPKAYSSNLFRRALTKGSEGILEGLAGRSGMRLDLGERLLAKELKGKRPAATAAASKGQAAVLVGAKKAKLDPNEVINTLGDRLEHSLVQNGLLVPVERAQELAESGAMRGRNAQFEFVYERPAEAAYVEATGAAGTPLGKNMIRVYRGEKLEGKKGRWFTPDKEYAKAYSTGKGRGLRYVDVPKAVYLKGLQESLKGKNPVFPESSSAAVLPREWAGRSLPVERLTENQRVFTATAGKEGGVVATRELHLEGYEHEQMMAAIKTMAQRVETGGDASRALVKDGHVVIVRKGLNESYIKEIEDTATMMDRIYRAPLTAWKGIILGLSPRYFVNNVTGNMGMYAAATNPVEFTRGMLGAVKATRGIRAEAKLARQSENTLDGLMAKYMPDEWVHSRFGYLQHGALGVEQTAGVRLKSPIKRAGHAKFYAVTEQVAYRGPQRASLMGALHTDSDFRNLYRSNLRKGMKREQAYRDAADTIISDPRKAAAFEKRVTDWAGQYYHLNSLEKKLTAFVPFYTWDRHALRFGKEQVLSRPVRSIVLAQLGALGDKEAEKELGKLPDFMKGAIPLKGYKAGVLGFLLGQNIAGRKKIMLTAGYNPLAAAADDADAIAAIFGQGPRGPGEAIGGQLNPVVSGAISGVTGQRLFSGAQAETHGLGLVGGAYEETFPSLAHYKLIQGLLGVQPKTTTKAGKPTLYEKGMRQTISSLLGLNERDFSPESARSLYNKEQGLKKGRRRKKKEAASAASSLKSQIKSNF